MVKRRGVAITDHFEDLEDRRIERSNRNQLLDIISIAICAVICGANSWVYVEMLGRSKEEWFVTFLKLPNGTPPTTPPPSRGQALRRCVFPAGPGAVSTVLHAVDPGSGGPYALGGVSHRRQDGAPFPWQRVRRRGYPSGHRLGLGQHPYSGASEG